MRKKRQQKHLNLPWLAVPMDPPKTALTRSPNLSPLPSACHEKRSFPTTPHGKESPYFLHSPTTFTDEETEILRVAEDKKKAHQQLFKVPSKLQQLQDTLGISSVKLCYIPEKSIEEFKQKDVDEISIVSVNDFDAPIPDDEVFFETKDVISTEKPLILQSNPITHADIESSVWSYCGNTESDECIRVKPYDAFIDNDRIAQPILSSGQKKVSKTSSKYSQVSADTHALQKRGGSSDCLTPTKSNRPDTAFESCKYTQYMRHQSLMTPEFFSQRVKANTQPGTPTRLRTAPHPSRSPM